MAYWYSTATALVSQKVKGVNTSRYTFKTLGCGLGLGFATGSFAAIIDKGKSKGKTAELSDAIK